MSRALVLAILLPLAACGPKLFPGTDIEDTEENKAILDVVEGYRRAVEGRNVEGILRLTSPRYFDDGGTPEGNDDVDHAGLQAKVSDWATKTRAARLEVQVKRIFIEKEGAARVRYFYDLNHQFMGADAVGVWKHDADLKEMLFKKEDGAWKITSGL